MNTVSKEDSFVGSYSLPPISCYQMEKNKIVPDPSLYSGDSLSTYLVHQFK